RVFTDLFVIAMQVAKDGLELANDLAVERNVHAKDAVGRRMLRPHRDFEQFAFESRTHCLERPFGWFESLDGCGHLRFTIHRSRFTSPERSASAPSNCGRVA